MEVSGQIQDTGGPIPGERAPGVQWMGSWMGPWTSLDAVAKRKVPSPCRESNPARPATSL